MTRRQKIIGILSIIGLVGVFAIGIWFKTYKTPIIEKAPEQFQLADGRSMTLDGNPYEWVTERPTYTLATTGPNSRPGNIWIDQTQQGLIIAGSIEGGAPQWPQESSPIAEGDHVEIWLADGRDLEMPPIGYGHQFGMVTLSTEDSCDNPDISIFSEEDRIACKEWYRNQLVYRDNFKKLFMRQWQIASERQQEVYSRPAFNALNEQRLIPLSPSPVPLRTHFATSTTGYTFEFMIPWENLPPIHALQLKDLRILVDVFNPGESDRAYGSLSSTSKKRTYAQPSTFNTYSLFNPINYSLTSCNYQAVDKLDQKYTYFIPQQNKDTYSTLFTIGNEVLGYQYAPYETSRSPAVFASDYFVKEVDGGIICGPDLSMKIGDKTIRSTFGIQKNVEVKKLGNDDYLIKQGPDEGMVSRYGTGACGACPTVEFDFYYIDIISNKITRASDFALLNIYDNEDMDYTLSPAWDKVTIYNSGELSEGVTWNSIDYCFNSTSHQFEECGMQENILPPSPRNFTVFSTE